MRNRDRQILKIALPAIVTNITVPLLGLVDTAIVGHMGAAAYIGGIAVGSMIFNLVYWVFGFLRMGTSGMTAQARGRRDMPEVTGLLSRSMVLSMAIALLMIVLQWPLHEVMLKSTLITAVKARILSAVFLIFMYLLFRYRAAPQGTACQKLIISRPKSRRNKDM